MSKTEFAFEIKTDKQTVQLYEENGSPKTGDGTQTGKYVYNTPIEGRLYLQKVDEETKELLSGAVFRVFRDTDGDGKLNKQSDESVGNMTEIMDDQGKGTGEYEMNGLPYGTYFIYESVAPVGFVRNTTTYTRNIRSHQATVKVGNFNGVQGMIGNKKVKGNVTIIKLNPVDPSKPDEETRLEGAVFTVYNDVNHDHAISKKTDTVYGTMLYDAD